MQQHLPSGPVPGQGGTQQSQEATPKYDMLNRKKSRLSEVFKVPSTPGPAQSNQQGTVLNEGTTTPSTPITTRDNQPKASTAPEASAPSRPTFAYAKGKGNGKNSVVPASHTSSTQKQIWEANEQLKVLELFLQENPVRHF